MTNPPRRTVLFYLALLLVSGLGVAQVLLLTRNGIGITPDSLSYLAMAEAVQQGGIPQLVQTGSSHFPPFYSILLALPGADPLATAVWLNALLFGLTIWLTGLLISQSTDSNPWIALTGAGMVAVSSISVQWYILLLSEPLFLTLALTSLWALGHALQRQQRGWLVLAGIAAGLGFATRYVGVTLVLTGGLSLLLFSQRTWRGRVLDSMLFGVLAVLPVSLWLLRNTFVAGRTTTSTFAFYPMGIEEINEIADTLTAWLAPGMGGVLRAIGWDSLSVKVWFVLVLLGSVVLAITLLERDSSLELREQWQKNPLFRLMLLFGGVYVGFVVFSRAFLYINIPLDTRILLPTYIVLVYVSSIIISRVLRALPKAPWALLLKRAMLLACLLFLVASVARSINWHILCDQGSNCLGYNSPEWHQSETIAAVRALGDGQVVYSNNRFTVEFLTNATALSLPSIEKAVTGRPNPSVAAEIAAMQTALKQNQAVVVYFEPNTRDYLVTLEELQAAGVRLRLLQDTADGALYVAE